MEPVLITSDAENFFNIYEFYTNKFSGMYVDPKIFIEYNLILLIAFIIRLCILYKIERRKKPKNENECRNR